MNKPQAIDAFAARLLMLSFFLPEKLQTLATMVACVYFVVRTVASKTPIPRTNYLWAIAIGSLYFLYLFSIPFTPPEYKPFLLLLCERKASLLLMPFAFAIISPYFIATITKELRFFVYGCLVSCVLGNADYLYHYLVLDKGAL